MKNNQSKLLKPVQNEILNPAVDLTIDYAEIGLDSLLDNVAISEIPIVKSIVGATKIIMSVKERYDLKKILTFFREFQSGEINNENIIEFQYKFNTNEKYRTKVVETIVLLNERFLDVNKSKILANLFKAHINKKMSWEELNNVIFVLDNIHPKGFSYLKDMSEQNWYNHNKRHEDEPFLISCGIGITNGTQFKITKIGQDLYNFGLKPILQE